MNKEQVQLLTEKGFYEGEPLNGVLLETHISWVILSKKFAFKIKKPEVLSFLDFSTLQKRKFYCKRELELNSRLTSIYLDVLPVRQSNSNIYIGTADGEVMDYAIRMKKLQAAKKMDILLSKRRVDKSQIKILAHNIAAFHLQAKVVNTSFNKTWAKENFNDILELCEWAEVELKKGYAKIIKKMVESSNNFLNRMESLINKRIKEGFQRDCHGDLHSGNIFLYQDPVIFDCIEFNDLFRHIDVLNDLAFICMDLEANGEIELSRYFMACYQEIFPCIKTQRDENLFIYYKCYRANIRTKVNALRAKQISNLVEKEKYTQRAKMYFDLMQLYSETLSNDTI